ncbi:hypothetical protein PVAND_014118 [Polypedilum vanderplanki]|uniref:carnitine O-palmitoyltransferase n=1 Tax=Polypedilum vanderplanki TaxID=319348 RepID=A0A9J6CSM8_POLVA|nr:hypothetical protein PVAND_014118 [Polypedilum vanderplanki]
MSGFRASSTTEIKDYIDAHHNDEILQLVWLSGLKSWKHRYAVFKRKVQNGVYPAHLESLFVIIVVVMAFHFSSTKVPYDLLNTFISLLPSNLIDWQILLCVIIGFLWWLSICLTLRYTLKLLLMYKGYLFETRGKGVSLKTKVWAILVKLLLKWNSPVLYSFQGSLPRLSVPDVNDTIKRYLASVRPIYDDETYDKVCKDAEFFENGIAKKLQRYLVLKSWWADNYVSDWWEEYAYLKSREPLMYGSNYYGSDTIYPPTNSQAARAANLAYLMLKFRDKIVHQELPPIMLQSMVPLCSSQYERLFNTARIPGIESDKIIHVEDSKHIVVMHKGSYYKLDVYYREHMLNAADLQYQIEEILQLKPTTSSTEKHLPSLTAWNRTKWAEVRDKFFSTGINKESLEAIESAAFIIALDDEPYIFDLKSSPEEYGHYGKQLLVGNGHNRWFDKSFNLCVGSNGKAGIHGEHTWADASIVSHLLEDTVCDDYSCYDSNGRLLVAPSIKVKTFKKLQWDLKDTLLQHSVEAAYEDAIKILEDIDHQIINHNQFGKGFIKKCRVSPDAFIQMALQLAYYRDYGKFSLTYEASTTRLYREGRTETVRSCTIESSKWVKAMENPECTNEEKIRLLREACNKHQKSYLDSMTGKGIDRHLFCLYIVSKYLEVDSPFLDKVFSEPWRLTTSQTPLGQTPKTDINKFKQLYTASGGFGPVVSDGYGVSYIILRDDIIFFHVSSKKSCSVTNTDRFGKQIVKAMSDIKQLFELAN